MSHIYGIGRVLEPAGTVPASAWKIDNNMEPGLGEARVTLNRIHIDTDSFRQLCSSCAYDEERIKAKILYIVQQRGKLHNPVTNSGGALLGSIEKLGPDTELSGGFREGDAVYCSASLTGIPLHIEELGKIDYSYGQVECRGSAIIYASSNLLAADEGLDPRSTLNALNEGDDVYQLQHAAKESGCERVLVIGRDVMKTLLYAQDIRLARGRDCKITVVMNQENHAGLSENEIRKILLPTVQKLYFLDLSQPQTAFGYLREHDMKEQLADLVLVIDGIEGAETLAVLAVQSQGAIHFVTFWNHASNAILAAESLGKEISIALPETSSKDCNEMILQMLEGLKPKLTELNRLYEKHPGPAALQDNQISDHDLDKVAGLGEYLFGSEKTRDLVRRVINVARFDCNVIIEGETGVGKEKILDLIHRNSARKNQPCIKINCSTIPSDLAESEFFGYESGAFTGASQVGRKGYFEMANGGTLFLDEIETLPLSMQSKLLRVLQENQFYRIGGAKQVEVDVRVICASNIPLEEMVARGSFREDLYYRLNICTITLPALRERVDDIPVLAQYFLSNWNQKYGINKELTGDALTSLCSYPWPGNVRELENAIHRLVINADDMFIGGNDVDELLNAAQHRAMVQKVREDQAPFEGPLNYYEVMEAQERKLLEYALQKGGTTRKAAELIGLSHTTFVRKKLKYGL